MAKEVFLSQEGETPSNRNGIKKALHFVFAVFANEFRFLFVKFSQILLKQGLCLLDDTINGVRIGDIDNSDWLQYSASLFSEGFNILVSNGLFSV